MNMFTQLEVKQWLDTHQQTEDPHHQVDRSRGLKHVQYYAPKPYSRIESLVARFVDEIIGGGDILFQLYDWDVWNERRAYIWKALWPAFDESREIGQAGGCLYSSGEAFKAAAMFSLTTGFLWQSYLYAQSDKLVIYNWEGEILDVWSSSAGRMERAVELFEQFELKEVPKD